MKKILVSIVLVMLVGISTSVYAAPEYIILHSVNDAGSTPSVGQELFFEAGRYEFSVYGGAFSVFNSNPNTWAWGAQIYQNETDHMLGDYSLYSTGPAAESAHLGESIEINHESDDYMSFYINDSASDNKGKLIMAVNTLELYEAGSAPVAPEPISSILFLTGGATLGLRYLRKKRSV